MVFGFGSTLGELICSGKIILHEGDSFEIPL